MTIRPLRGLDESLIRALMKAAGLTVEPGPLSPPVLVAERDGEVVGMIRAAVGSPYAIITEIAVHPDVANQGVGHTLVAHMETVLRVAGVTTWYAFVADHRHGVADQLERYGAVCTGHGRSYRRDLT